MKNIKELGLEIIQLEDQVLLVKGDWQEIPYIKNVIDDKVYMIAKEKIALEILSVPVKNCPQIIASTKPLEGLPLLVIEDELAEHEIFMIKAGVSRDDITNWKKGYSRAKETFKFTEEDLRKVYTWGLCQEKAFEEVVQFLTKKELWVDAHWNCCGRCIDGEDKCTGTWELNIENNTIKAVWK